MTKLTINKIMEFLGKICMKNTLKHIMFAFTVAFISFVVSSTIYAQAPAPCNPDCEDTAWHNNSMVVNLRGCNQYCYAKIYFSWRIACGVFQDVQVTKVESLTPYCNLCSIHDLYMQALYAIITLNPMGFNPQIGTKGCNTIWRVTAGGCIASWQIYYHDPTHEGDTLTIVQKCVSPSVPCCLAYMQVCRYPRPGYIPPKPDSVTISSLSNSYPEYNCKGATIPHVDTLPPPPDTTSCQPICEWFTDVVYQTPIVAPITSVDESEIPAKQGVTLYPNPTDNKFRFDINSPETGELSIEIYDLKQNVIKVVKRNILEGWNSLEIDVTGINTGNYFIVLNVNGTMIHSTKLEIIK